MKQQLLNCPPKSKIVKPTDINFAEAAAKTQSGSQNKPAPTMTTQTAAKSQAPKTFDY